MLLQEKKPKNLPELDQTMKLTLRIVFPFDIYEFEYIFTDMKTFLKSTDKFPWKCL